MRPLYSILLAAALSGTLGACAGDADAGDPNRPWLTARFAMTSGGSLTCADHENQDTQFPSNADRVVTRVSGYGGPDGAPAVHFFAPGSENAAGEISIDSLPPGESLTLEIAACSGAESTWVGETRELNVEIGAEAYVDVFLTPVDALACVGDPGESDLLTSGHMFGTSAPIDHRRVWLMGGFLSYDSAESERRLQAGKAVSVYDVPTASLSPHKTLLAPRAMAAAVVLPDGRVVVAGGVSSLSLKNVTTGLLPPLWPEVDAAPTPSIEILDPTGGDSVPGPAAAMAALPSCAGSPSAKVVCVGGVEPDETLSSSAWVVDDTSAQELDLQEGRFGATVVATGDGKGAFVWGGQIGGDFTKQGIWISLVDTPTPAPLTVIDDPEEPFTVVPLFASGAQLGGSEADSYRFVVLGGSDAAGETTPHSTSAQTARAFLFEVNPNSGFVTREAIAFGGLEHDIRRFAGQLIPLEDDRFWLLGGVTSFANDFEACPLDNPCFQKHSVVMGLSGAAPQVLSEEGRFEIDAGAFGMSAAALYDGSWLISGGLAALVQGNDQKSLISKDVALIRHARFGDDLCALDSPASQ
jgi:hypothetical protein